MVFVNRNGDFAKLFTTYCYSKNGDPCKFEYGLSTDLSQSTANCR